MTEYPLKNGEAFTLLRLCSKYQKQCKNIINIQGAIHAFKGDVSTLYKHVYVQRNKLIYNTKTKSSWRGTFFCECRYKKCPLKDLKPLKHKGKKA